MKILKYLILLLLVSGAVWGYKSTSDNPPIKIGMPKIDVYKVSKVIAQEYWVIRPSETATCLRVIPYKNIEFLLAFDSTEHVKHISTSNAAFKLPNGLGVNSTFAELKKQYENYRIYELLGHARYFDPCDGTLFGFIPIIDEDNSKIEDEEKVKWIELQEIP